MVSADVFDSLPPADRSRGPGQRAGHARRDRRQPDRRRPPARRRSCSAGSGSRDGEGTPIPFARVFPVGRLIGRAAGAVRRRLDERGLSRPGPRPGRADDQRGGQRPVRRLRPRQHRRRSRRTRATSAGARRPTPLPWGSYGFASLSMGRDRYAEYAAQRIARASVDRLLDGHLQPGSSASGTEQVNALLDSQWPAICERLELPAGRLAAQQAAEELGRWMTTRALPREQRRGVGPPDRRARVQPVHPVARTQQAATSGASCLQRPDGQPPPGHRRRRSTRPRTTGPSAGSRN